MGKELPVASFQLPGAGGQSREQGAGGKERGMTKGKIVTGWR
jgi:hypothetical protein